LKRISKTNAMRILEQRGIAYEAREYEHGAESVDGITVTGIKGVNENLVFKTLVTDDLKGGNYVFIIPVMGKLDLKAAAKSACVKNLEMVHVKELFPLTGYVRGGCSPIGMKKSFPTFLDGSALEYEHIFVSGGKIGCQIYLAPKDLLKVTNGHAAQLVV